MFYDTLLAVISGQASYQLYPIFFYLLSNFPTVIVVKTFIDSNNLINDIGFVLDGSSFFSVSSDNSLRNMTRSPYNNLFETSSIKYLTDYGTPHSL